MSAAWGDVWAIHEFGRDRVSYSSQSSITSGTSVCITRVRGRTRHQRKMVRCNCGEVLLERWRNDLPERG